MKTTSSVPLTTLQAPVPKGRKPLTCLAKLRTICGGVVKEMRTQAGFARRLGVSTSYVVRIENKQVRMTEELAHRIARLVGVDWKSLMDANGEPRLWGASDLVFRPDGEVDWEASDKQPRRRGPLFTSKAFRQWNAKPGAGDSEHEAIMAEALAFDVARAQHEVEALLRAAHKRARFGGVAAEIRNFFDQVATGYGIRQTFERLRKDAPKSQKTAVMAAQAARPARAP